MRAEMRIFSYRTQLCVIASIWLPHSGFRPVCAQVGVSSAQQLSLALQKGTEEVTLQSRITGLMGERLSTEHDDVWDIGERYTDFPQVLARKLQLLSPDARTGYLDLNCVLAEPYLIPLLHPGPLVS